MKLHDYQLVARDFLRGRDRAGLFLDMGLGKTACVLSALEPRHLPALVVAPKRVAEEVWPVEAQLWRPDLRVAIAKGAPGARTAALAADDVDVVVLGRDNLGDVEKVKRSTPFKTLIVDELSGFKTRNTQRWKAARRIVMNGETEYVWGLTGTPTPNGYMDLWAQMYLLDGGHRLQKNITAFRERWFTPGRRIASGIVVDWDLKPGCDVRINERIADICLAMSTEGRIKLPPLTFNSVQVELPASSKKAYKDLKDTLVADLREFFDGQIHSAANAAVLTSKLSQVTAGFLYHDDSDLTGGTYEWLHDEKIKAAREIVDGTGSPVLMFYRFRAELDHLRAEFPHAKEINDPGVIAAWNRGEVPILLAHPQSAGHGLNLQAGGHTIVWTTLPWSLEEWQQANKRLHRQNQINPVVIHMIMGNRTVDYLIRARLEGKTLTQDALLAHLESPI